MIWYYDYFNLQTFRLVHPWLVFYLSIFLLRNLNPEWGVLPCIVKSIPQAQTISLIEWRFARLPNPGVSSLRVGNCSSSKRLRLRIHFALTLHLTQIIVVYIPSNPVPTPLLPPSGSSNQQLSREMLIVECVRI